MYPVEENELKTLCSTFNSVHFGLAGIFLGATVSLLIAMGTIPIPEPVASRFFSAFLGCSFVTIYCGSMAVRDWFRARGMIKNIKTETVEVIVHQKEVTS